MESSIKERFIEDSIKYGLASEAGNSRVANKKTTMIEETVNGAKEQEDGLVKMLSSLLEHEENYVKLKAAYYLIPYMPEMARKVLKELSLQERGQLGFEAKMILYVWDNGEL